MDRNFARSLKAVLVHEGGYVNNPKDPGGATNKGVTLATFRTFVKPGGTIADLKAITDDQIATVYRRHYWDKVLGAELPSGVDFAVFDFAVNSGPRRAIEYLQRTLNVTVDGVIGPVTIRASKGELPQSLVDRLCDARLAYMNRIKDKQGRLLWKTFGRGWARRVKEVRELSMSMATASPQSPQSPISTPDPVNGIAGILKYLLAAIATFFRSKPNAN
jgi:lysozyme family protein